MGGLAAAGVLGQARRAVAADPTPFDGQTVRGLARALAAAPFKAPDSVLPEALAKLGYDDYRQVRFDPAQSLWRGAKLPFEVQFFHRGWLYKDRVDLFEVVDGKARPIEYRPEMFDLSRRISASPASACTPRSTGPTTTTRSRSSSAPATSAPSAAISTTASRRAAWRSTPPRAAARSSPPSAPSSSSGRSPAPTASSFRR